MITDQHPYDVVVVGGGGAGLTAASVAAARGMKVLLVECSDLIGGTTAISGGMVWIPANQKMRDAGFADSVAEANIYLDQTLPPDADRELRDTFIRHGDEMISFLESHTALRLRPVSPYPDYYPECQGATGGGRVLEALPFDGTELGKHFATLRPPLQEFMLFGRMMVSRTDIPHFRRAARSLRSFARVTRLVSKYLVQRLRSPRGTTLYLGNALAARLYKSALDLGVEIQLGVRVERLLRDHGRIGSLEIEAGGERAIVQARRGVILATGGVSHDAGLRAWYVPEGAGSLTVTADPGKATAGARLAMEVGGRMRPPRKSGAFWMPASRFNRRDGSSGVFPHVVTDRAKPGLIAVDSTARRFINEAVSYHEFGLAQLRAPATAIPAYLVCDRRFLWKYGLGCVKPFALSVKRDVASGYLKRAPTVEALAAALGIPAGNLRETVADFNADAVQGVDRAFGRGSNIYQRHLGDADHRPNPCVAPIETAPFYAVSVFPADLGMSAGLLTDVSARVTGIDGAPIPGLYACGNDMDSLMAGAYPGPGITLGPALTFAYIAACDAAMRE